MKLISKGAYLLCMFILLNQNLKANQTFLESSNTKPAKKVIRAGVSQMDITPPVGTPLAGYAEERVSTAIHDTLWSKAIVLEQGKEKFAFIFCDLIEVSWNISKAAREQISHHINIPVKNIIVAATHSHTGPEFREGRIERYREGQMAKYGKVNYPKIDYPKFLVEQIVTAVIKANDNLQIVTIEAGNTEQQEQISFNRRFYMKDGTVRFNPGRLNPDIVKPEGPIDPDVNMLMLRNPQTKKLNGGLTVFAMHLDVIGGTKFSADYAYFLEQNLKKSFGVSFMSAFAAGACGNINHINVKEAKQNESYVLKAGQALSKTVIKEVPNLKQVEKPSFKMLSRHIKVPGVHATIGKLASAKKALKLLDTSPDSANTKIRQVLLEKTLALEGLEKDVLMEIQVFRVDKETAIVGLPGEIFVELGLAIKRNSPFKNTIVMTLCNDKPSYIPTKEAFPHGSYEVEVAIVQPGGGEIMVKTAIDLLKKLD
ncbi:MAG TPA: neutral/alkaline non-lysosomal ceramidase N-terminal domain-containing protein [Sphingobacteriaceae bacterium]|nr:neutral/alkaline non-lysosomal ceramidase N-terminal domain-containing protein [Sphingobacteriaceae bacterium]